MSILLFLIALLFTTTTSSQPPPLNDEVLFLVAFKSSLHDPTSSLSSWSPSDPSPCSWPHLLCDADSRVSRLLLSSLSLSGAPLLRGIQLFLPRLRILDLSSNSLSGPLPDQLPPLLRSLDLSANSFSASIPSSLFSSYLRYLSLSSNNLTGSLPPALSQCRFLLHLNLSDNRISGSPDFSATVWPLTRLRVLDLSGNSLSGPLSDDGLIASVHNLKILRLDRNAFSGPVPLGIGLCPHLYVVDLHGNFFDGGIPYTFRSLRSLSLLDLSDNRLSGELPSWIANLSSLERLDLSRNGFRGEIPDSVGGLKSLNYLSLSDNKLNGSIPRRLFDTGIQILDLSSNNLTGEIPLPESSKLALTIRWLDLANNQLTGEIPVEMSLYMNLRYLNLSWNGLRSQLPPELGTFRNLSVLDLRRNEMFGEIPGDLCESGSLSVLQLDGNSLSGNIPGEIGNCSSLYLLSLSHNELSGPIPSTMSNLKNLKILNLELNTLTGEIPLQLGTLDNLLAVNISHNRLVGRLPTGSIFPSLDQSSLQGNLGLCSPLLAEPCKMNVPKPLVLDPNAYINGDNDNMITVPHRPFSYKHNKKFFSVSTIIAISAALVIICGVLVVSMLNVSARRRLEIVAESALESTCSSSTRSGGPAIGKTVLFGPKSTLRSEDLVSADSLLNKAVEIGRGALGTLYKSSIGEGRVIAIKKLLTPNIVQYHDEFDREIRILAKARHPNLIAIKGYYWTPQLQLLISDFAPNGSLHSKLYNSSPESTSPPLTWENRFKIVHGIAKALAYLHHSIRPPIIHYNIKPSNILLDDNFNAKVSDFGLAKLLPKFEGHIMSSRFQSTMGYMAPELACSSLRVNEKCDVYAFGVVVLELVTGRRAVECGEDDVVVLVDLVRAKLEEGNVMECVDGRMGEFPEEEVLPAMKLGMVCASQIPSSRPTMGEVVQILNVIKTPVDVEGMGGLF